MISQHQKKSFEVSFKKLAELFLKITERNYKNACLRELKDKGDHTK